MSSERMSCNENSKQLDLVEEGENEFIEKESEEDTQRA
jgi:hypothetical protein